MNETRNETSGDDAPGWIRPEGQLCLTIWDCVAPFILSPTRDWYKTLFDLKYPRQDFLIVSNILGTNLQYIKVSLYFKLYTKLFPIYIVKFFKNTADTEHTVVNLFIHRLLESLFCKCFYYIIFS